MAELDQRCARVAPCSEVILATSPSVEGEATAVYISKLVRPLGMRATASPRASPSEASWSTRTSVTLARAIDGRREM